MNYSEYLIKAESSSQNTQIDCRYSHSLCVCNPVLVSETEIIQFSYSLILEFYQDPFYQPFWY